MTALRAAGRRGREAGARGRSGTIAWAWRLRNDSVSTPAVRPADAESRVRAARGRGRSVSHACATPMDVPFDMSEADGQYRKVKEN